MRYYSILLTALLVNGLIVQPAHAALEDVLGSVLQQVGTQAIGTSTYQFSPGDAIIKTDTYSVFYSGIDASNGVNHLLLTLEQSSGAIPLRFANPDIIQIRTYRLQVVSFDNSSIQLKVLSTNQARNY